MVKFVKRLTAPSKTNKFYIHISAGGLNSCIKIGDTIFCLPNCVGYAWGRANEMWGVKPKLSRRNAELWYGYTEDGYKRGQTPKLGAIGCFRKGVVGNANDGAGHVVFVEEIYPNGDILVSQSAYGGSWFTTKKLLKSNGYNGYSGQVFQGFIYPPVEFEEDKHTESAEKYKLSVACKVYTNADNAKNKKNSVGVYQPKEYYVFKRANGMINITKTPGKAGGWINPADNVEPPKTEFYKKYTGKSSRIDEVFAEIGVSAKYTGKWDRRIPVAKANGIIYYAGTYYQNTKLINLAKQGKLVKV